MKIESGINSSNNFQITSKIIHDARKKLEPECEDDLGIRCLAAEYIKDRMTKGLELVVTESERDDYKDKEEEEEPSEEIVSSFAPTSEEEVYSQLLQLYTKAVEHNSPTPNDFGELIYKGLEFLENIEVENHTKNLENGSKRI
eukprot:UN29323